MKSNKIFKIICLVLILVGAFVYVQEKKMEENKIGNVDDNILEYFKENHDYEEILACAEEDINNDGQSDLIVIYKKDKRFNEMVGVIQDKNKNYITKPVLAPKEDILIEFKNINDKDEIEVVVTGSKNGSIGYAIYTIKDKELFNLFGEGMEACC
ncbi:MAG: Cys-Cys-COOH (seleno)protein SaoC [Romboutsia sp.]